MTRTAAFLSLISALMSLTSGCMYLARFGTMRSMYCASRWAEVMLTFPVLSSLSDNFHHVSGSTKDKHCNLVECLGNASYASHMDVMVLTLFHLKMETLILMRPVQVNASFCHLYPLLCLAYRLYDRSPAAGSIKPQRCPHCANSYYYAVFIGNGLHADDRENATKLQCS